MCLPASAAAAHGGLATLAAVSTTHTRPPRIPAAAQRLRLPVWTRSQTRMRDRYGFDLSAPDMLERIRSLVAEKPEEADRVLLLAAALSLRGEDDLALHQARRAVELAPDSARAHTTLGTLQLRAGEREAGLGHARRAGELDGEDPSVLYNLGLAEWSAGERSAARDIFTRAAIALDPQHVPTRRGWWPLRRRG